MSDSYGTDSNFGDLDYDKRRSRTKFRNEKETFSILSVSPIPRQPSSSSEVGSRERYPRESSCSSENMNSSMSSSATEYIISSLPPNAQPLIPNAPRCGDRSSSPPRSSGRPCRVSTMPSQETYFASIQPAIDVITPFSQQAPYIEFLMKRKVGVVTFQWEPFSFTVPNNGVSGVNITQSFGSLPPYPMSFNYSLSYNSTWKISRIIVDSTQPSPIRFYFNLDLSGSEVKAQDTVSIPASTIEWITKT